MKYAVEMGSGTVIYIPSFIKIGAGIQKLMGEGNSRTQRQYGELINVFAFFQNKESRQKMGLDTRILVTSKGNLHLSVKGSLKSQVSLVKLHLNVGSFLNGK
jgi:hypothetical protein